MIETQVTIYTQPNDPFCRAARRQLQRDNVTYVEIDVSQEPDALEEIRQRLGFKPILPVTIRGADIEVGYFVSG